MVRTSLKFRALRQPWPGLFSHLQFSSLAREPAWRRRMPPFVSALPANSFCVFTPAASSGAHGRPPPSQGWRRTIYRSGLARPVCSWLLHVTYAYQNERCLPFCRLTGILFIRSRASMTRPWPVPPSGPSGSVVNQALKRLITKACDLVERRVIRAVKRETFRALIAARRALWPISLCAVRLPKGRSFSTIAMNWPCCSLFSPTFASIRS